jgi:polyketide biosynthesis acyl carrier protein
MDKQAIFQIISQHTREVVPGLEQHPFQFSDSLRQLGANSIDRSEILMMTLESLALNVPLLAFARAENMGDVAAILHEKLQPA